MAIFFDAPVAPDALTAFVRLVPVPSELRLLSLFPTRTEPDNTFDFAEITRTNRTARFRSFDGRIHVSARDTGTEKRGRLLPLSTSLTLGEYERLQLEFARTGGTNQRALAEAIYNDGQNLVLEVLARLEQAWGDVLTDGKLTINENGFQGEADFGVPSAHLVTPATAWSSPSTATVLSDLRAWRTVYVATNGVGPGAIRTSQRVLDLMLRNTELINAAYGSAAGRTWLTLPDLNGVLASHGLPPVADPYDTQVDVDGTTVRVIADDRLLFTPADLSRLGDTRMGVSATALELVNSTASDLSFAQAPGIVGVVDKSGPPYRQQTLVDAVGMPVLTNARALLIADVA